MGIDSRKPGRSHHLTLPSRQAFHGAVQANCPASTGSTGTMLRAGAWPQKLWLKPVANTLLP